ncbi:alpha/beta fold hydrolase [Hymenobacter yonginensis]|uniref:Alpha/beta hydrolase n=1 Tax=Hymenobacter yonginensis TaxID=748197 RepID=A0ABY7PV70_9BACT|nr:alpha/beta hydrolase [Hymenobacter yonginensis]WBO86803.1 alpha/beta hydrolase [Hymenobacter yonginensis]
MALAAHAQEKLSYLLQTVDVAAYPNATFEVRGQVLIEDKARHGGAIACAVASLDKKNIKSYFDKYGMDSYKPGAWTALSVSGRIDRQANKLSVGMFFSGRGRYYFDDFELLITSKGKTVSVPLGNAGFEADTLRPWYVGEYKEMANVRLTTDKARSGRQSLLIDNSRAESEVYGDNTRRGRYATVNGVRLYYELYGAGEPLLLLHGNNSSINAFSQQIPALAKSYQVIALDSRGQGNSQADTTRLTYELFADDAAALLEVLGVDSARVLGWSDGGNIGLLLAMRHPGKVRQLASMAAVLYNDDKSVSPKLNAQLRRQLTEMKGRGVTEADMEYRLKNLLLTEPHIAPEALAQVNVPVLVMAGENDIFRREHTDLIATKLPRATLKIFRKAGHEAPTEVPAEFNQAVLEFFAGRR